MTTSATPLKGRLFLCLAVFALAVSVVTPTQASSVTARLQRVLFRDSDLPHGFTIKGRESHVYVNFSPEIQNSGYYCIRPQGLAPATWRGGGVKAVLFSEDVNYHVQECAWLTSTAGAAALIFQKTETLTRTAVSRGKAFSLVSLPTVGNASFAVRTVRKQSDPDKPGNPQTKFELQIMFIRQGSMLLCVAISQDMGRGAPFTDARFVALARTVSSRTR